METILVYIVFVVVCIVVIFFNSLPRNRSIPQHLYPPLLSGGNGDTNLSLYKLIHNVRKSMAAVSVELSALQLKGPENLSDNFHF